MEYLEHTNEEVIEAAARGDAVAWRRIVTDHASLVWSVARGCGLQQNDAEDVAQTVFSALIRRLPHLRDRSALSGWLVVSAKREAWRISARNRRLSQGTSHEQAEPQIEDGTPNEEMERMQAVRASLSRLDDRCRTLLIELFGVGETPSYEQIAERLGVQPNSVGPTRRRCLDLLLKDLQETAQDLF